MSSPKLFPGVGKAVGRSSDTSGTDDGAQSTPSRSSSTGRSGSRDCTPVIARYAILSAAEGAVAAGTVVEGRGVTSSVALGSTALLLDGGTGGEPRTSTPARLSRVLTPLKGQGRRLTHTLAGVGAVTTLADLQAREEQQRQQEEAAAAAAAQRRIERRSRRKMRRWANDRLLGVAQVCGTLGEEDGAAALAEGEYGPFLDGAHPSKFSTLMAAENTELRDRFLAGYGGKRAGGAGTTGGAHAHSRRTRPSLLQDAEARFLRLERRLRGLLTQLVGDGHMASFLDAVEEVLKSFLKGEPVALERGGGSGSQEAGGGEATLLLPEALARSLARPLQVDRKGALVLPLNNSAFFRLLVHGCCQYYGLRSHSENLPRRGGDAEEVRAVFVAKPSALLAASPMTMCAYIKDHRLNQHLQPKRRGGRCLNEASEEECVVARAAAPVVLNKPVVA